MKKVFFILFLLVGLVGLVGCGGGSSSGGPLPDVEGHYVLSQASPSDCRDLFGSSVDVEQNNSHLMIPVDSGSTPISGSIDAQGDFQLSGEIREGLNVLRFNCSGSFQNDVASLQCNLQGAQSLTCSLTFRRGSSTSLQPTGGGTIQIQPSNPVLSTGAGAPSAPALPSVPALPPPSPAAVVAPPTSGATAIPAVLVSPSFDSTYDQIYVNESECEGMMAPCAFDDAQEE